jgi:glycine hydroxymethyltransferase
LRFGITSHLFLHHFVFSRLLTLNSPAENAALFRPKLIIAGASAYPREWDYARLRKVADKHGAFLMADMAHISGLVAVGEAANPFEFCDVVTTTTHKSLRGPRAGLIFFRRGKKTTVNAKGEPVEEQYDLESKINFAVFPSLQGGPHENTIAAVAVAMREAQAPEFKTYIKAVRSTSSLLPLCSLGDPLSVTLLTHSAAHPPLAQVRANAKRLGEELVKRGYSLVTGGTDNHLVLWDVRPQALTGNKLQVLFDHCSITLNKNAVYGDTSALAPGGVRLGSPAMTTRGLTEEDFVQVRSLPISFLFLHRCGRLLALLVMSFLDLA